MILSRHILRSILLLMLLFACGQSSITKKLQLADYLADNNPDSALLIIKSIEKEKIPKQDSMRCLLINIHANDKKYILPTSDKKIRKLLEYYIEGDRERDIHPEVFYYAGRTYADLGKPATALKFFKKSLSLLGKNSDVEMRSRLHSQIADIFMRHHMYRHALRHLILQLESERQINDDLRIITLLSIAFAYQGLSVPDSAEMIYRQVGAFIRNSTDSINKSMFYSQLGAFLLRQGRYEEADSVMSIIPLKYNQSSKMAIFSIMNDRDIKKHDYSNLESRSMEMARDKNIYVRRDGIKGLANLSIKKGDPTEAIKWVDKYLSVSDTIFAKETASSIPEIEEMINNAELEQTNLLLKSENTRHGYLLALMILGLIILILISTIYILAYKRNKLRLSVIDMEYENFKKDADIKLNAITNEKINLDNEVVTLKSELTSVQEEQIKRKSMLMEIEKEQIVNRFIIEGGKENCKFNSNDFAILKKYLIETSPEFMSALSKLHLNEQAFKDAMLIKIGISQKQCANIFHKTPSAIANSRARLMEKLTESKNYKNFSEYILTLDTKNK